MGHRRNTTLIYALCVALTGTLLPQSQPALAAQPSSLSKWLSKQAVPDLRELLGRHPRYENQRVAVVSSAGDALSAAIVTVLLRSFPGKYNVQLRSWQESAPIPDAAASSIDRLRCADTADFDYVLRVSATSGPSGVDEVQLQLAPVQDQSPVTDGWRWAGRLSKAERSYLRQAAESSARNGSLAAPWRETDSEAAARALSRDFACALRPQLRTRVALDWHAHAAMPGVFSDTLNISRHLLANYRELGVTVSAAAADAAAADAAAAGAAAADAAADYAVDVRLVPLRENNWQLWLIGAPRQPGLAPVQAVTYFSLASPEWPGQVAAGAPVAGFSKPRTQLRQSRARPQPGGEPLDYLDVKLLDTTQTDGRGSRAALQVTLQLGNRAEWPLEYSFTLSGGHFNHCIAAADYYRHDRYGSVEGSLAAGESVVRRLVIENAEHRPRPIFGMRKCAGFRDLDAFEEFDSQGQTVTDYVRWQM